MKIKEFFTGPLAVRTIIYPLNEQKTLIVDPGGINNEILRYLKTIPCKIPVIALTHAHFDHIGGIVPLIKAYPKYELWVHKNDAPYLGKNGTNIHIKHFGRSLLHMTGAWIKNLPDPTHYYTNNDEFYGFHVLHTPGHTPGSICLWKKDESILFSGDTLFYRSHGRSDFPGGNQNELEKSLSRLATLPDITKVYPGHDQITNIGSEKTPYGIFTQLNLL